MKKHITYLLLSFILLSCNERYKKEVHLSELIPNDYNSILKINSLNDFKALSQSDIPFGELKDTSFNTINFFKINTPIYITKTDSSTLQIVKYKEPSINTDSTDSIIKDNTEKDLILYNGDTIYRNKADNHLFYSNNYDLTQPIKRKNVALKKLMSTSSTKEIASFIFRKKHTNDLLLRYNDTIFNNTHDLIDINSNGDNIVFSGVSKSIDSLSYIDAFKNTIPQKFELAKIIPSNTKSLTRISFDDYSIFSQNLSEISGRTQDSVSEFLSLQNEISLIENKSGKAILMHALDAELLNEKFSNVEIEESFRGISVFKIENQKEFRNALLPFIAMEDISFGFIIGKFSGFSNNIKALENIISSKLNNLTLSSYDKFNTISEELANESSLLYYKDGEGLYDFLKKPVKGYNANAIQYVYDKDFAHINGVFQKYRKSNKSNSVTEDFSTSIDTEILLSPQLVKNHRNNTYEIVVQDIKNQLYLISNSGTVLWSKQLSGPVLGKINQIDIYKNGRLQMVFATQNRIYVINRNGADVGPFPKKFNDEITQPLSVFDYDNRKNYRLLVTQNKSLLMFDTKAKRVNGFNYSNAKNTIKTQPKHFRIGSKDYIVFAQGNKLEILNRQGKERVKTKSNIEFSNNNIFLYQNKFTTLDTNGMLVQVDTKGKVNTKTINLTNESQLTTTSKTLVGLNENKLTIKDKVIDLDYGNYTKPKIFYLNDKIYISVTDLQSKKIYLFDSSGKLLPNFPIFGTAAIQLQNLDKKRGLELITLADEKTILTYKIN